MYFKVFGKLAHHGDEVHIGLTTDAFSWIYAFEEINNESPITIIMFVYIVDIVFKTSNDKFLTGLA